MLRLRGRFAADPSPCPGPADSRDVRGEARVRASDGCAPCAALAPALSALCRERDEDDEPVALAPRPRSSLSEALRS